MPAAIVGDVTEYGGGPKMSLIERGTIPAGWYPDQSGADQLRWWDGQAWSTEVRPLVIDMVPDFATVRSTPIRPASTPERSALAPHVAAQHATSAQYDPNTLTRRQLREMLGGPLTTHTITEQTGF